VYVKRGGGKGDKNLKNGGYLKKMLIRIKEELKKD
jgi:hypothetical protein